MMKKLIGKVKIFLFYNLFFRISLILSHPLSIVENGIDFIALPCNPN